MKLFEMIVDDGDSVYKVVRPAQSLKALKALYCGNGEFVRIKDVTEFWTAGSRLLTDTGIDHIASVLKAANYGAVEISIITSLMQQF